MFIGEKGSDRRGLKSIEDQVSTDISDVVRASQSDLTARGVAIDLLQTAKRVGPRYEAANTKICLGRKVSPWTASLLAIEGAIESFRRRHSGTLNESTNVGVKTGGSRVGGLELCV